MRGKTANSDPRALLSNHWKGTNLSCILLTPAWNLQPHEAPGHCGRIGSRQQDLGAGRAAATVCHWSQAPRAGRQPQPWLSRSCHLSVQPGPNPTRPICLTCSAYLVPSPAEGSVASGSPRFCPLRPAGGRVSHLHNLPHPRGHPSPPARPPPSRPAWSPALMWAPKAPSAANTRPAP